MSPDHPARWSVLLLSITVSACSSPSKQEKGEKEPTKQTSAPEPSGTAARVPSPPTDVIPTLVAREFKVPDFPNITEFYPIDGALMVTDRTRVGRISGNQVEWAEKKIPPGGIALGNHTVDSVHGRWPDGVGVIFSNENGRAPEPTYYPMIGEGMMKVTGEGGMMGWIRGVATVEDSTIIYTYNHFADARHELVTVRGKISHRLETYAEGGCPAVAADKMDGSPVAIEPDALQGTTTGTLVSIGTLCIKRDFEQATGRGPAAEVWPKQGKVQIVDLSRYWPKILSPSLLKGKGEELFAFNDEWETILRFHDGAFEALPDFDHRIRGQFVDSKGELNVSDGEIIYRLSDGKWVPRARFAAPESLRMLAMDGDALWANKVGGMVRFEETKGMPFHEECKAPYVYLYPASRDNPANFTYPTTAKALSTFPKASELSLAESEDDGKFLGISVPSKELGEAVIAHLKTTMKDEHPRLLCYQPQTKRSIAIPASKP